MKNFRLADRLVETRFLVRHKDGGWAGYNYEWNSEQTEAFLLSDGKTTRIHGQSYTYPSRIQCMRCHTAEAGQSLGLETVQMNRRVPMPSVSSEGVEQLALFEHLGLFDSPLPTVPAALESLPRTADEEAPLALRARAYLHANCSHCHRPGGPGAGPADFRFATAEADMGICDVPPDTTNFGVLDAMLLKPGEPEKSIISLRMHDLGQYRMPPIGKNVVDQNGVKLIDAWIESMRQCQ